MSEQLYPLEVDERTVVRGLRRKVRRTTLLLVAGVLLLGAAMSASAAWLATDAANRSRDQLTRTLQAELDQRSRVRDAQRRVDEAALRRQMAAICVIVSQLPASPDLAEIRRECHQATPPPQPVPGSASPRAPPAGVPTGGVPPSRGPTAAPSPKPDPKPTSTGSLLCLPPLHICL